MSTDCTIIERAGELFILENWQNHFTKPIKYKLAWPTGVLSSQYPHFVGKKCTISGTGIARMEDGVHIRLKSGAYTKPAQEHCKERPIPKPPWAHEYRNGRWCR